MWEDNTGLCFNDEINIELRRCIDDKMVMKIAVKIIIVKKG